MYRIVILFTVLTVFATDVGAASSAAGPVHAIRELSALKHRSIHVQTVSLGTFRCELVDANDVELVVRLNGVERTIPDREIESVSIQSTKTREGLIIGTAIGALLAIVASRSDGCVARGCNAGLLVVPGLGAAIGSWLGSRQPTMVVVYKRQFSSQ